MASCSVCLALFRIEVDPISWTGDVSLQTRVFLRGESPATDTDSLPTRVTTRYCPLMGHYHRFKRGDLVVIVSGRYEGHRGVVDSAVFQRTVDYPDEFAPGYHVVLEDGTVVTVRWDQVKPGN